MLEALVGAGFVAWLGLTSAVTVGVLAAVLVVQLVREALEVLESGWQRLQRWWWR